MLIISTSTTCQRTVFGSLWISRKGQALGSRVPDHVRYSMEVLFFTEFSKRKNSTKVPNDATGITKTVYLKGTTDKINPTFYLKGTDDYVYCKAWGWYYFVHRIGYDIDGAQMVYCNIDVLASFKAQILGTRAFVKYSSSNYSNKIIDDRVTRYTDTTWNHESYDSIFVDSEADFKNEYVFFVTVGGEYSQGGYSGGYNYYVFTETGWNDFCALLCNGDYETDIKKFFASVDSGLISCRRMPIKPESLPTEAVDGIRIGRVSIPYPALKLSQRYIHRTIHAELPVYKYDFNQWSPYTRLKMYIPFIGTIDLPTDLFKDDTVLIDYVVDLVSGQMDVHICHNSLNNIVQTFTTEIGGQLPTSVNNVNLAKVAAHGASAVGLLAAKNVVGAMEQAASAVSAGLSDNIGNKGTFGGGRSEVLQSQFILYSIYWQPVFNPANTDFIELYGRPCYKVLSLSELTGYVQTIDFSIDLSALDVIKDSINSLMDTGVYIE